MSVADILKQSGAQIYQNNHEVQFLLRQPEELELQQNNQQQMAQVARQLQLLEPGDQKEWLSRTKLTANRLYRKNFLDKAEKAYMSAITGASILKDNESMVTILCNLSACMLAQNKTRAALQLSNQALKIDKKYPRAYERRIAASFALGQLSNIKRDIAKGIKYCNDDQLMSKFRQHQSQYAKETQQERGLYSNMMKNRRNRQFYEEEEDNSWTLFFAQILAVPYGWYKSLRSLCGSK